MCAEFFFFKQKTAYEMRISDWSSTCALPISVLERDTPLPAGLVRDRLCIGTRWAGILARHRDRTVAGQPMRPVLETRFERLFDQQRAKARAVDEEFAVDYRAIF